MRFYTTTEMSPKSGRSGSMVLSVVFFWTPSKSIVVIPRMRRTGTGQIKIGTQLYISTTVEIAIID